MFFRLVHFDADCPRQRIRELDHVHHGLRYTQGQMVKDCFLIHVSGLDLCVPFDLPGVLQL